MAQPKREIKRKRENTAPSLRNIFAPNSRDNTFFRRGAEDKDRERGRGSSRLEGDRKLRHEDFFFSVLIIRRLAGAVLNILGRIVGRKSDENRCATLVSRPRNWARYALALPTLPRSPQSCFFDCERCAPGSSISLSLSRLTPQTIKSNAPLCFYFRFFFSSSTKRVSRASVVTWRDDKIGRISCSIDTACAFINCYPGH